MSWFWLVSVFIIWALFHSLTAARPVKRRVRQKAGYRFYAGFYRLAYNVVATLSFLPVLYVLAVSIPPDTIWRVPWPWSLPLFAVQLLGVLGLVFSLLYTDALSFLGLRQAWRYLQGEPEPERPATFVSSGPYALVRHPLYFFSLLVLWFTPLLTLNVLLFNLLATLYFWLGAFHEEQRLLAEFGDQYRRYREEVPAFLPFPR